ncbi:MAG: V-type ATP synthase subunit D [Gammaproteobacteria bacterium]|jgi:V/A-type H+-transporting ATPase subunit D|nr:V-type ATP synthase subunit D [Gammaproteobacteria bacterium]
MEERLKIPPTKSTLLTLRRQVAFLEKGHTLLERKKELLTRLVYQRLAQYRQLRGEARTALEVAYRWLSITHMRIGGRKLRRLALGLPPALDVTILPRSSLGVEYPAVTAERLPLQPVALMGTDTSLDQTRVALGTMALVLARLGEAETALWRLLEEQRKTQKRVNALRYNVIPKYRNTIRFIEASLEEEERNTLFQIKVLREQESA